MRRSSNCGTTVPCFHDLSEDQFTPIGSSENTFIRALVALAPELLAPVLTQLNDARTCDDGTGWLVVRGARGEPCRWPEGYPFDIVPTAGPGPQGCHSMMLWFDGDGQLQAVEFLMLESTSLELGALTKWLAEGPPFQTSPSPSEFDQAISK